MRTLCIYALQDFFIAYSRKKMKKKKNEEKKSKFSYLQILQRNTTTWYKYIGPKDIISKQLLCMSLQLPISYCRVTSPQIGYNSPKVAVIIYTNPLYQEIQGNTYTFLTDPV